MCNNYIIPIYTLQQLHSTSKRFIYKTILNTQWMMISWPHYFWYFFFVHFGHQHAHLFTSRFGNKNRTKNKDYIKNHDLVRQAQLREWEVMTLYFFNYLYTIVHYMWRLQELHIFLRGGGVTNLSVTSWQWSWNSRLR